MSQRDSGALFKNLQRQSENSPDYRGDITINGKKYWLSAWIKEGRKGKFMSLAVKPAEEKQEQPRTQGNAYAEARGLNDEIPF